MTLSAPGAVDKLEPLKPTPTIEEGDFHSIGWALFARDLEVADDKGAFGVVHWFTQAVQAGYVPPDAMLRWLAERFGTYLGGGSKSPRLDECLGLAPGKRRREARTIEAVDLKTQRYVTRLALLEFAGFTKKAAVLSLHEGVAGVLPPLDSKDRFSESSLPTLAATWRKSADYRKHYEWLKANADALSFVAKLRKLSSNGTKKK